MKETLNYIEVLLWGYSGFAPMSLNVDYNKSIEQLEERLQALEILNYGKMFDEATSANGKANLQRWEATGNSIEYKLPFMEDRQELVSKHIPEMFIAYKQGADRYKADGLWTDEQWREYRVTLSIIEKAFEDRIREFATAYDYCMEDNPEPQQEQPEQPKRGKKVKHMIDLIIPLHKELIYKRLQDNMAGASPDVAMDILIHNIKNKVILKPSYNTFAQAFPDVAKDIPESSYYYKIKDLE